MIKKLVNNKLPSKFIPLFVLLGIYLLFSLMTFKDYGITLDEPRVYNRGQQLLKHFSHRTSYKNTVEPTYNLEPKKQRHAPILSEYHNLYAAGASVFNKHFSYERYHFFNMAFASILIVVSYLAFYKKFGSAFWASLAPILIFTTPRFLGHIPANPKDVPFAVIYISTLLLIYLVEKSESRFINDPLVKSLIFGVTFGLTQSFRVVGYSIYIIYLLFVLRKIFVKYSESDKRHAAIHYLKVFIITTIFAHFIMAISWPYIGSNFFANLKGVLIGSTTFVEWNKEFLFNGSIITPETRPNSYLFVWILITTPVYILFFFVTAFLGSKKNLKDDLFFLLFTSLMVHTIVYLIIRPNIYNGLRHYLFYVVNMSLLGAYGFVSIIKGVKNRSFKFLITALLLSLVALTIGELKKLHPYEYIYFSNISGGIAGAEGKFPLDYWGASYKEASEWITKDIYETGRQDFGIYVQPCNASSAVEYYGRGIFKIAENPPQANYVICPNLSSETKPSFSVIRDGVIINAVYKTN